MMASPRSSVGVSARCLPVLLVCLLVSLLSLWSSPCAALLARVSSHSEQCFFEMATKGDKVVGNLRVVQGGSLDIDLRILDPQGKVVLERPRVLEESWQFYAQHTGQYTLCLSNLMSVVSGKVVRFNLYVGSTLQKKDAAKSEHFNPLEKSVMKLAQGVREVSDWTRHIKTRERVHHNSQNNTHTETGAQQEWQRLYADRGGWRRNVSCPKLQRPPTVGWRLTSGVLPCRILPVLRRDAAVESTNLRVLLWRFLQIAVRHTRAQIDCCTMSSAAQDAACIATCDCNRSREWGWMDGSAARASAGWMRSMQARSLDCSWLWLRCVAVGAVQSLTLIAGAKVYYLRGLFEKKRGA